VKVNLEDQLAFRIASTATPEAAASEAPARRRRFPSEPAWAIQDSIQRSSVADDAEECGLLVVKTRETQDEGRKGPVRAQYSRKQLTGQTKLAFREDREKDCKEPATCFIRGRERGRKLALR